MQVEIKPHFLNEYKSHCLEDLTITFCFNSWLRSTGVVWKEFLVLFGVGSEPWAQASTWFSTFLSHRVGVKPIVMEALTHYFI